jgi:hypothetical protein
MERGQYPATLGKNRKPRTSYEQGECLRACACSSAQVCFQLLPGSVVMSRMVAD